MSGYSNCPSQVDYDAIVIGSGPNGLAAGIVLAQSGLEVLIVEGHSEIGGGTRTAELTLPGFHHDVCSAIHPMGLASPFLKSLPLTEFGLEWIHPEVPLAHPLEDGSAVLMHQSVEQTADQFSNRGDAQMYRRVFDSIVRDAEKIMGDLMAPPKIPSHPFAVTNFGVRAVPSALAAARSWFSDEPARALLAGNAAHAVMPLDRAFSTNAIGLMLMMAGHHVGWPFPKGGSHAISKAMAGYFESLGGKIETGCLVEDINELPKAASYVFDTSPSALSSIAGSRLPDKYRNRLKAYRHGPGVFKVDYALSEPVPWSSDGCGRAGTVHVGGTLNEIVNAERECWNGIHSEKPFVLSAQQSLFDRSRAPEGCETFWAYCHVPHGSTVNMTEAIENQIERFAPGFRDCILAKNTMSCVDFQSYNPNFIGGDIVGGVADWRQLLTRPDVRLRPHTTPSKDIFICSASSPPGAGVHGMGGYWAAQEVLRNL